MECQVIESLNKDVLFQAPPPPQPIIDQPGSSSQPSMASPDTETPMQTDPSSLQQQQAPTDTAGAKRGRSAMEDDDYDF